mmetsp:Transcript_29906/g.75710  ORF Transcript_29906/g.75710 Transcript_29906/m.75710 type:complete len:274 (+) Transcript_29906:2-823(+)
MAPLGRRDDVGRSRRWLREAVSVVQKTIFAGPMWVALLGLEGTGHHGICESLVPRCEMVSESGEPCLAFDADMQIVVRQLAFALPDSLSRWRRKLSKRLTFYANLSSSKRILFQCSPSSESLYPHWSFMMSYPDAELGMQRSAAEEGKVTAHPDAVAMALAAERAGLDARFVVLRRDAADAVASISKRSALAFDVAARILRDNEAILEWQLRRLSPDFFFELPFESAPAEAAALAVFLRLNESALEESLSQRFRITTHALSGAERAYVRHLWR